MLRNADYIYENNIIADGVNTTKQYCKKAQVGVDVTAGKVYVIANQGGSVLKDKTTVPDYLEYCTADNSGWVLYKGTYIVALNEGVQFGPGDTGFFIQRSSLNRCGCEIISSVWDPGFTTQSGDVINAPTLRLNVHADSFYLEKNARVAQLIVAQNESSELYNGQFQGGRLKSKLDKGEVSRD